MTVRILYVERNPHTMELISRILKYLGGYKVIPAWSEQSGIAIATSTTQAPDLILLGVSPDDARDQEAAVRLRQSPDLREVPILMIADRRLNISHRQRIETRCEGCIVRPASAQGLLDIISEYLPIPATEPASATDRLQHRELHSNTIISLPIHDE